MFNRLRRMLVVAGVVLGTAVMGVVTAPTAAAEDEIVGGPIGGITSGEYIFGWKERTIGNPTEIRLQGCGSNPDLQVWYRPAGGSWVAVGAPKRFWCLNSDSGFISWGRLGVGDYMARITDVRWNPPVTFLDKYTVRY